MTTAVTPPAPTFPVSGSTSPPGGTAVAARDGSRARLPRSLVPLPTETLLGYVLRLAHRLDLAPGRVCVLTGLGRPQSPAMRSAALIRLSAPARDTFATLTALSGAEVTALTLQALTLQPPSSPGRAARGGGLLWQDRWLLTEFTRYCPDCLAGDGSVIQQRHGGPWRTLWRLGLVFACPVHARLLEHRCPGCGLPVQRRDNSGHVLGLSSITGMHPACCRNTIRQGRHLGRAEQPCGHRLDTTGPPLVSARADHIALATRIQSAFILAATADPTDPTVLAQTGYLRDLRVLSCMISASWPAARDLAPTPADAIWIDQHVDLLTRHTAGLHAQGRRVMPAIIHDRPPEHAQAAAALLSIADTLARSDDPIWLRQHLRRIMLTAPPLRPWLRRRLSEDAFTSPHLRIAAGLEAGAVHVIAELTPATPRHRPPRPVRFTVDHVPQLPSPQWCSMFFAQFFADDDATGKPAIAPALGRRLLRRAITIRLAQHATGSSVAHAGTALGMAGTSPTTAVRVVRHQLGPAATAAFDTAVEALAAHLDTQPEPVDYGRRRRALASWSLRGPQWDQIVADLVPLTPRASLTAIDWGATTRDLATVRIWAQVTGGDYVFAPLLRPDPTSRTGVNPRTPEIQHRWSQLAHHPHGHYARLRDYLDHYAQHLTARLDHGHDPDPAPHPHPSR